MRIGNRLEAKLFDNNWYILSWSGYPYYCTVHVCDGQKKYRGKPTRLDDGAETILKVRRFFASYPHVTAHDWRTRAVFLDEELRINKCLFCGEKVPKHLITLLGLLEARVKMTGEVPV